MYEIKLHVYEIKLPYCCISTINLSPLTVPSFNSCKPLPSLSTTLAPRTSL